MNKPEAVVLKHRPVRDLAWALQHPAFFEQLPDTDSDYFTCPWRDKGLAKWLSSLDADPSLLLAHLKQQRSTRLGVYFEQLLSFYFSHYPRFELIAKNLQVFDGNLTLGEYDFLVHDKNDGTHMHIEVAVKFYTARNSKEKINNNTPHYNWHHWVGPNQRDTLGIKMRHLFEHQLQLKETQQGQQALKQFSLDPHTLKRHLLLTGRLYLHISNRDIREPDHSCYPKENYSFWLHINEMENALFQENNYYLILPRQLWMADVTEQDIEDYKLKRFSAEEIANKITNNKEEKEFHIAEISKSYQEKKRFFILK